MAMSVVYTVWDGQIISENRSGVERDYVPDPLGNTIALVDSTHAITDSWLYWPYGEIINHVGSSLTPFAFLGTLGYFQDFMNQLYVRARFLRAELARWLTVDRYWPNFGAYGYAGDTPQQFVDPSGAQATANGTQQVNDCFSCLQAACPGYPSLSSRHCTNLALQNACLIPCNLPFPTYGRRPLPIPPLLGGLHFPPIEIGPSPVCLPGWSGVYFPGGWSAGAGPLQGYGGGSSGTGVAIFPPCSCGGILIKFGPGRSFGGGFTISFKERN